MKIKFVPLNKEVECDSGQTVLSVANANGVPIHSVCKGGLSCAECRIKIVEGVGNVLPPTKAEINLIGSTYFVDGRRLACQVRAFGDIIVDISEQMAVADAKKPRGHRLSKSVAESKAVLDTIVLEESSEVKKA